MNLSSLDYVDDDPLELLPESPPPVLAVDGAVVEGAGAAAGAPAGVSALVGAADSPVLAGLDGFDE